MPPFRRSSLSLALCAALSVSAVPALARDATTPASEKKVSERATIGVRAGEVSVEGYADFIMPLWSNDNAVVFFNPRLSLADAGAQEINVGFGARRLFAEQKIILGANAYYDNRFSSHGNRIAQYGLGLEFLSEHVDARANWYDANNDPQLTAFYETEQITVAMERDWDRPYAKHHSIFQSYTDTTTTTTTHQRFERHEAGLDGYDAELGVKLPLGEKAPQVKLFLGYYDYDNPFGDDIRGAKGRIEVKASDYLTLDAEVYENDDLNGSRYFVGARLNLPFDLSRLAQGKNPFSHPRNTRPVADFAGRLNEMVMRDVRVQDSESEFAENEGARTVNTEITTQTGRETLLRDVNFVNNGNHSGIENGTAEFPWDTIQEGVDNVFGEKNVYVFGMTDHGYTPYTYTTNVVLTSDVKLFGSGAPIYGFDGYVFGGGAHPTVDGAGLGPVITLANSNQVRGFYLVNTATAPAEVNLTFPDGSVTNVANAGIVGNGVQGEFIFADNVVFTTDTLAACVTCIQSWADGILLQLTGPSTILAERNDIDTAGVDTAGLTLEAHGTAMVNATVRDNIIDGDIDGIFLSSHGSSVLNLSATGNEIVGSVAIDLESTDTSTVSLELSGNELFGIYGLYALINDSASVNLDLSGNAVTTLGDGVHIDAIDTSVVSATFTANAVEAFLGDGISLHSYDDAMLTGIISGGNLINAGDDGIDLEAYGTSALLMVTIAGNTINAAEDGIDLETYGDSTALLTVSNNLITATNQSGVDIYLDDSSIVTATLTGNTISASSFGALGIEAETDAAGTSLCFGATGNTITAGEIGLLETAGSLNVTSADATALSTANNGVVVNASAGVSFGGCP